MAAVLTIIPYPFYPPVSGGALRCFYIIREMARQHSVCVLTVQPAADFEAGKQPAFPANVRVVSIYQHKRYQSVVNSISNRVGDAVNYRFLKRSLSSDTNTFLLDIYPSLQALLKEKKFDIIYYESLEILGLLKNIIAGKSPSSVKLYDAHNCDTDLWQRQALYEKNNVYLKYSQQAKAIEQNLYKDTDGFFCCSQDDNIKLSALNQNRLTGIVIPNGVDIAARPFDANEEKHLNPELLFCGSLDYFPNQEGLLWFYNTIFPVVKALLPAIRLTVIGNLTQPAKYEYLHNDASVNFIGRVDSVVPYYKRAAVSIVPLKSGSGTRLKILEAMSMGNPVVSTVAGAEGIDFENGKHILIADNPQKFAAQILFLLSDKTVFNRVRTDALQLVTSTYDWQKIGVKINENVEKLLLQKKQYSNNKPYKTVT